MKQENKWMILEISWIMKEERETYMFKQMKLVAEMLDKFENEIDCKWCLTCSHDPKNTQIIQHRCKTSHNNHYFSWISIIILYDPSQALPMSCQNLAEFCQNLLANDFAILWLGSEGERERERDEGVIWYYKGNIKVGKGV